MSTYIFSGNSLHVLVILLPPLPPATAHVKIYKKCKFIFLFFFVFHQEEIDYVLASVGDFMCTI